MSCDELLKGLLSPLQLLSSLPVKHNDRGQALVSLQHADPLIQLSDAIVYFLLVAADNERVEQPFLLLLGEDCPADLLLILGEHLVDLLMDLILMLIELNTEFLDDAGAMLLHLVLYFAISTTREEYSSSSTTLW